MTKSLFCSLRVPTLHIDACVYAYCAYMLCLWIRISKDAWLCVCVCVCVLDRKSINVHWKQSGGGEGSMTARLACSADDPTHHVPPGSSSSKHNIIFYCASPGSGLWIGRGPKLKKSLIKYLYVGDLAHMAKITALTARFSTIKALKKTFRFV